MEDAVMHDASAHLSITAASPEVSRLWRVMRTVHQMLLDRGYMSRPEHDKPLHPDLPLATFIEHYCDESQTGQGPEVRREKLAMTALRRWDASDTIMVVFNDERSVGIKSARNVCQLMIEEACKRGIMVHSGNLTPSAKKVFMATAKKVDIETFVETDLLVNITKHVLVPKHDVLDEQKKMELLQRYRLKETQLPRIQLEDPVAKYYGLRRGQVVKITRPSETAGRYVTYRLCL